MTRGHLSRLGLLLAAAALLAGCAPAARVTLLPQADGRPSAVEVRSEKAGTQVLSAPYQTVAVARSGKAEPGQTDAATVNKEYGQLLSVQPAAESRFTLFFMPGGSQLTPESEAALATILTQATQRPGGEIVVTGHTDTTGATDKNDALSLQRAGAIRQLILQRGFAPARVYAVGRGERELAVQTADEVDEPKNRRAEIVVR